MAWDFNGTSAYGQSASTLNLNTLMNSSTKITVAFWVNHDTYDADTDFVFEWTENYASNSGAIYCSLDHSSGNANFSHMVTASSVHASLRFTQPGANAWHHVCMYIDVNVLPTGVWKGYVDGVDVTQTPVIVGDAQSSSFINSLETFNIAARDGGSYFGSQSLQDLAFWNVELAQGEINTLAAGYSPLFVRPSALAMYFPMRESSSPAIDPVNGVGITMTNATVVANTRTIEPIPPGLVMHLMRLLPVVVMVLLSGLC